MQKKINLILLLCVSLISVSIADDNYPCSPIGDQDPNIPNPKSHPLGDYDPEGKLSVDPNEIIGPTGVDSVRWISINDILNYTIMFENDPEFATAAAQRVDVRFDFPNKGLQKKFGIGTYCFSNMSYNVENSPNAYQNRINLADSLGIYVDVIGGLDVTKNQGFWNFSTIDPETGYAPWEHNKGLLQVNDSTHVGEGFVTFSLKPLADMHTGDTISIQARIVFDDNDTIPTNRWCNMVDAGMPVSKPVASVNSENDSIYNISFVSSDDEGGSGVGKIALYLANNSGLYEEYGVYAPDSIVLFPIEQGKQYKLFSIATDRTGNMEPLKEEADVVVNFNQAPTDIALSNDTFNDDLDIGGFIGELSTVDSDTEDNSFTYALAEGEGAIHNDMFIIENSQLKVNDCLKCSEESTFNVRISTTDAGGLSFSKPFILHLNHVLDQPETTYIEKEICEGDIFEFFGRELDKTGEYSYSKANELMCDSVFVLNLQVKPIPEPPTVTIENGRTLVSSVDKGNLWFKDDEFIEGVEENKYTPSESGIYWVAQSNGSCYSQPSDKFIVNLDNSIDYNLNLAAGWSWISSNLSDPLMQDPRKLLEPIIDEVDRFVSTTSELVQDPGYGLVGNLDVISPTSSYKIKMRNGTSLNMIGSVYFPDDVTINLGQGWNWIGYLPMAEMSLEDALSQLNPQEGDIIKDQAGFSVYQGDSWVGTLNTVKLGEGLMYYSHAETSFKYPFSRIVEYQEAESDKSPMRSYVFDKKWGYNIHDYPDNITIIAQAIANDVVMPAGTFTIGAFVGDNCRGIGQYVNDRIFITVHGSSFDDKITFKAIENATGNECGVTETLSFTSDIAGNYTNPYLLHINNTSGISYVNADSEYVVYPTPVRDTLYINGNLAQIKGIRIIAISGLVLISEDHYNDESGIDVTSLSAGHYICGIVTDNGIVYKRFVKGN